MLLPRPVDICGSSGWTSQSSLKPKEPLLIWSTRTHSLLKEMLSPLPILVHMLSMFWLILARLQIHKTPSSVDSRYNVIAILGYNLNTELHCQLSPAFNSFQRPIRKRNLIASIRDKHRLSLNINENSKYFSNKNWYYQ